MLTRIVAVPNLSFLDVLHCANSYGFKFIHLDPIYEKRYKLLSPSVVRVFSHLRPVYTSHFKYLELNYQRLTSSKSDYLIMVGGNPIEHVEYDLESYEGSGITPELLHSWDTGTDQPMPQKMIDTLALIHTQVGAGGLLQQIYPLFYRERDKHARTTLQNKVYAYLVGDRKTPPVTDIGKLNEILQQSDTQKFRDAIIYARSASIDAAVAKYGIDKFEISYLLQKVDS